MAEDVGWKDEVYNLKNHLDLEYQHDWHFELRMPSGMRLDAWIPDEQVCIEFKTARPHITHVHQVWIMMLELEKLKVPDVEFQLWYAKNHKADAFEMAKALDFEYGMNEADLAALAIPPPDAPFKQKYHREQEILKADIEEEQVPPPKNMDHKACQNCSYFEFCHL